MLIVNYIYVFVCYVLYFKNWLFFFVLDCFLMVLEVVVVLMLIVYVFEVWKKICIINKYVEFVGEMEEYGMLCIGERNFG